MTDAACIVLLDSQQGSSGFILTLTVSRLHVRVDTSLVNTTREEQPGSVRREAGLERCGVAQELEPPLREWH